MRINLPKIKITEVTRPQVNKIFVQLNCFIIIISLTISYYYSYISVSINCNVQPRN